MAKAEWAGERKDHPVAGAGTRAAAALLLIAGLGAVFILNLRTPRLADDYLVATPAPAALAPGAVQGRLGEGGPVGAAVAARLAGLPPGARAVVNTAGLALLLLLLVARLAGSAGGALGRDALAALVLVWFGTPGFGESFLWATGSGRFLWPTLAALVLLVGFDGLVGASGPGGRPARTAGLVIIAALVGAAGAGLAVGVLVFLAGTLVAARRAGRRLAGSLWAVPAALALGLAASVALASTTAGTGTGLDRACASLSAAGWTARAAAGFLGGLAALWPLWAALLVAAWLTRRAQTSDGSPITCGRASVARCVAAALASVACASVGPAVTARSLTPAAVLLAVAASAALAPAWARLGRVGLAAALAALVGFGASAASAVRDFGRIDTAVARRAKLVDRARALHLRDVAVPPIVAPQSRVVFWGRIEDVSYDASHWTNTLAARAWGLGTVRLIPAGLNEPLVDLARTLDLPLDGQGTLVGLQLSPEHQCLVVKIVSAHPEALVGGFLDVRMVTDRSSLLRRVANLVRERILSSPARGDAEVTHSLVRRVAMRLSLERTGLLVTPTSLSCVKTWCTGYIELPDAVRRVDSLYVGWRRGPGADTILHRLR